MASYAGFNLGWGMRLRIMLTGILVFGLVAGIMGLPLYWGGLARIGNAIKIVAAR